MGFGDFVRGGVSAAVIDEDDLEWPSHPPQHFDGAPDERQNVACFVVERNDEGELRRRRGHGSGVKRMQAKPGRNPRKDSRYFPRNFARTASAWFADTITSAPSHSSG